MAINEEERKRGKFIVLEGIDGCGKTTQIERLRGTLAAAGRRVAVTAEPTDGATGKRLREALGGAEKRSPCEMALLFALDRVAHNEDPEGGIERLLSDGIDVICDRYYYSSLAYQGSETDPAWVRALNLDCPAIRRPDLCVFLDLSPEESLSRIAKRGGTVEIYETKEKLTQVRARFFDVFRSLDDRVAVVPADGTVDEVAAAVLAAVKEIL